MISKKVEKALNDQAAFEFYSAHIYLAMSAYLESIDLPGMANWMRVQYQEELTHAEKFFDHIIEREGRAVVKNWDAPAKEWKSPLDAFESAYKHEKIVTGRINKLMDLAIEEKDHATQVFLQWFVTEQVEEESSVNAIVQRLKMVGDAKGSLYHLDHQLKFRKAGGDE
jgi:ferritin